jgi:CubicO group peptidase (beta-lactamase class C family)
MTYPVLKRLIALSITPLALAVVTPAVAQLPIGQAAAIDSFFARRIKPEGPGCVLGLIRGDSILHWRGYGLADVEARVPFAPTTIFATGSIYKQFFATSILLLARQGRLSLDDDIRKYLPEIPDYGGRISVRQLLDHTHGLREYAELLEFTPPGTTSDEATILRLLSRQREPAAPAGAKFQYGNTGPFLAGIIIARVTGEPAGEFTARTVLDPLGMRSTAVQDTTPRVPPRVPSYVRGPDGTATRRPGSRGSRTTLADLARWNAQFETSDPAWRAVLGQLATPGTLRDGTAMDFGLGLRVSPFRGLRRTWAPGGGTGGRAMFMRFPDVRLAVVLGCNQEDVNPISAAEAVADIVLAGEIARNERRSGGAPGSASRPITLSSAQAHKFLGTYVSHTGHVLRVLERDNRPYVEFGGEEHPLIASSPTRFTVEGGPVIPLDPVTEVIFQPGEAGTRGTVEFRTNWYPVLFTAVEPIDSGSIVLTDYAGRYVSEETGGTLHVLVQDGRLLLRAPRGEFPMKAVARDLFQAGPQTIRFARENGRVATAIISRRFVPFLPFSRREP